MDGVDASLIISDGYDDIEFLDNIYSKFPEDLYLGLIELRSKIQNYEISMRILIKLTKLKRAYFISRRNSAETQKRQKNWFNWFHGQAFAILKKF